MKDKLSPCPFCGNTGGNPNDLHGVRVVEDERRTGAYGLPTARHKIYYVMCGRCFARAGNGVSGYNALIGQTTDEQTARRAAIERWNRRTPSHPIGE